MNQICLVSPRGGAVSDGTCTFMIYTVASKEKVNALVNNKAPFNFGVDKNGNYGYYKTGADSVTPFKFSSLPTAVSDTSLFTTNGNYNVNLTAASLQNHKQAIVVFYFPFTGTGDQNQAGISINSVSNGNLQVLYHSGSDNAHFVNCAVAYISNITSNVTINITYNQNNVHANLRWRVFIV